MQELGTEQEINKLSFLVSGGHKQAAMHQEENKSVSPMSLGAENQMSHIPHPTPISNRIVLRSAVVDSN